MGHHDKLFEQYNRPVYTHVVFPNATDDDYNWIVYTGRRWIFFGFNPRENNQTLDDVIRVTKDYHGEGLKCTLYFDEWRCFCGLVN